MENKESSILLNGILGQWHPGKFDGDRNTKPKLGDRTGDRTFTLFSIM